MNNRKFKNWMKRSNYANEFSPHDSVLIQKALNGDVSNLGGALTWIYSPQFRTFNGRDEPFWAARAKGKARLSKRTRSFLAKLRDEAKRRGC